MVQCTSKQPVQTYQPAGFKVGGISSLLKEMHVVRGWVGSVWRVCPSSQTGMAFSCNLLTVPRELLFFSRWFGVSSRVISGLLNRCIEHQGVQSTRLMLHDEASRLVTFAFENTTDM